MSDRVASSTRVGVRPTGFGAGLVGVVAGVALFRPGVADPYLGATVWVAAAVVAVIGLVLPVVTVARFRVELAGRLADVDVGATVVVPLHLDRPRAGVEVAWDDRGSGWYRLPAVSDVSAAWVPTRRGVFDHLSLLVRSGAPLGLVMVTVRVRLPLPVPLHVGPVPAPVPSRPPAAGPAGGAEPVGSASDHGELVRGVRPYVVGDPAHLVHWPSSARAGRPMVRELERPGRTGLVLVLDLTPGADPDELEATVARAAGRAVVALADGVELLLLTVEPAGPTRGPVGTRDELRRRLARAVPGVPVVERPPGWPIEVVGPEAAGRER